MLLQNCISLLREAEEEYDDDDNVSERQAGNKKFPWTGKILSEKSVIKYWNLFSNTLLTLAVILMPHPPSRAIKDGDPLFFSDPCNWFSRGELLLLGRGEAARVRLVIRFWLSACLLKCCGVSHVRLGKKTQLQGKLFCLCSSCSRKNKP